MSSRRMFSKRIVGATRFVRMPATSQNLYFHLGINADDDGVVEAYPVMRMIGASDDDLRVLVAKEFVTILNDDYVTFLNDWLENNNIRADRKIDSIYSDLLLKIVPDAQLKEAKSTYYSRKKAICQTNDRQIIDGCQTNDSLGKDSIGKDRIGKDSTEKNIISSEPDKPTPSPSGILLPLNDKTYYNVPLDKIKLWEEVYPAVDVGVELRRMIVWLDSNPKKKKTRRGIERFINSWLARTQDSGGTKGKEGERASGGNTYNSDQQWEDVKRAIAAAGESEEPWENIFA